MHLGCKRFRLDAKLGRKFYLKPSARFAIEDRATRDWLAQHFFKAERLCAKLDKVAIVWFTPAALVLDRKGPRAKLDDVGAAGEFETVAAERQTSDLVKIMPPRLAGKVGFLVENPTFRGEAVLCPRLLKMNQRPLPRTEGKML